jgi:hypothetical protein
MPIAPSVIYNIPRHPLNQLLEADIVYVRDFAHADSMSEEQLKHLALVAHHCYRSFDLALRCVMLRSSGRRWMPEPSNGIWTSWRSNSPVGRRL